MASKKQNKVDRRKFLQSSGVAVAAGAATVTNVLPSNAATHVGDGASPINSPQSPALSTGLVEATIHVPWKKAASGPADLIEQFARHVEMLSGNKLRLILQHDPKASPNDSPITFQTEQTYVSDHPAFAYFAGLPMERALRAENLETWLTVGGGQHHWDSLAASFDNKPLLVGHLGDRPAFWSTTPIISVRDFAACHTSVEGLNRDVLKAIGAICIEAHADTHADALQVGKLTATQSAGTYSAHMMGLHKHAKHAYTGGPSLRGSTLSLRIKKSFWDRLSASLQANLEAAALHSTRQSIAENQAHHQIIEAGMKTHNNVTFAKFSPEIRVAFHKLADAIIAESASVDQYSRQIDASYMSFRNAISEQSPMM